MAIISNAFLAGATTAGRLALAGNLPNGGIGAAKSAPPSRSTVSVSPSTSPPPTPSAPSPAPPAPAQPAPMPVSNIALTPTALSSIAVSPASLQSVAAPQISPVLQPPIFRPPILIPQPPILIPPQNKTATQLATGAIAQLTNTDASLVSQALNAIKSRSLDGPGVIPYLERKVRIGEVLNGLAKDWTPATRSDFADAFNMDANNINNDVADSIVSIAILNDKDLEAEITAENTPQTTTADLTDNRRIVWQSVPPGTPLNPPYVILVAVDYQDIATAQDALKAITDQLGTTGSGFKLPKAVIQKGVN